MNYSKVNKALAKEFGNGKVEVHKANNAEWEYTLWFLSDNPTNEMINKAKEIVGRFEQTFWMDDKIFHS